ncbi:MAG: ABC transporter permease [Hyphomonadaceae bacterium]
MSLALSTLIFEWRRYMAAVISLAVAGVLMLALAGMFVGIIKSFTATVDRSRAQVIILSASTDSFSGPGGGESLPARVMPLIYRHPEVTDVADMQQGFGSFYGPGATQPSFTNIMVVDTSPNAVTLPDDFTDDMRRILDVPYNIAVDRSAVGSLGVKKGDLATINGRTVRIALIVKGYANTQAANVVMSRQTFRLLGQYNDDQVGMLMVRIKDPARADQVRDELNAMADGQYRAWTKPELSAAMAKDLLSDGFIAQILGFLNTIGFFIGVVITWQTLRGAILSNIKEFASMRALGASLGDLRLVIIELSIWVGVFGIAMAALAMSGLTAIAGMVNIPMGFQPQLLIQTAILLLLISIGSGMLTLGALNKGDPADLLR